MYISTDQVTPNQKQAPSLGHFFTTSYKHQTKTSGYEASSSFRVFHQFLPNDITYLVTKITTKITKYVYDRA